MVEILEKWEEGEFQSDANCLRLDTWVGREDRQLAKFEWWRHDTKDLHAVILESERFQADAEAALTIATEFARSNGIPRIYVKRHGYTA